MELELEFKHRRVSEINPFFEAMKDKTATEAVMSCAVGWFNVEEVFNSDNVTTLLENYHQASRAIVKEYVDQLQLGRQGN